MDIGLHGVSPEGGRAYWLAGQCIDPRPLNVLRAWLVEHIQCKSMRFVTERPLPVTI